jgi:hypothetical protein
MYMKFKEVTLEMNHRVFRINLAQLENAVIAFFFEDKMRLGTLAIAMHGTGEVAAGRSSVLVGGKYLMTTRALAEKLAGKTGKMALVSLFTELGENDALRIYAKLLDRVSIPKREENMLNHNEDSIRENIRRL